MHRRHFVRSVGAVTGLALLGILGVQPEATAARQAGNLLPADSNGLRLPPGFRSRVIGTTGERVGTTDYRWHPNPDGGATFAQSDGGWIYVSNDEASGHDGGASMMRFDRSGEIVGAGSILSGTNRNCAGGPTPWGTWLSCEEFDDGRVWECDPTGEQDAQVRPAMGTFSHEAAAADPERQVIYLTEDKGNGLLYRFTPATWGDLSVGRLDAMVHADSGVEWQEIPDPTASDGRTRDQLRNARSFDGGEGAWFGNDRLYFTTKGDNRVWTYEPATNKLTIIYDIDTSPNPVLKGVDNVTISPSGDLYVCEDGGNMEVVLLSPNGAVEPFLRMDIDGSEVTGVAFDPSGTRMYVSSQRNPGTTFEVTGPFRQPAVPEPSPTPPATAAIGASGRHTSSRQVSSSSVDRVR